MAAIKKINSPRLRGIKTPSDNTTIVKPSLLPNNLALIIDSKRALIFDKNDKTKEMKLLGTIPPERLQRIFNEVKSNQVQTGILPERCIFYERHLTEHNVIQHVYIFQLPTRVTPIHVHYSTETEQSKQRTFDLALPFIQLYVPVQENGIYLTSGLRGAYASCTQKPVQNIDDEIFSLPLNNVESYSGTICWGTSPLSQSNGKETASQYAYRIALNFMQSPFTNHYNIKWPPEVNVLGAGRYAGDESSIRRYPELNYEKWEALSKENPGFILTSKLGKMGMSPTVGSVLTCIRGTT